MAHTLRTWLAAVILAVTISAGSAMDGVPADRMLEFEIVRQGSVIGHDRIRFGEENGRLTVEIDVAVKVDVAFITVYRFVHIAREIWEGGRLVAMTAQTDNDGAPHQLGAALHDDALVVTHNGAETRVAAGLIPISLWNPATVRQSALFDSVDGEVLPTTVTPLGRSAIATAAGPVTADGYLIDAGPDFKRRVWYSESGKLVAVQLEGRDGSEVVYRLR